MDVDDFRWAFIDYGFQITRIEAQHLLETFDKDGNGFVDCGEFLSVIKVSVLLLQLLSGRNEPDERKCSEGCVREDGLRSFMYRNGRYLEGLWCEQAPRSSDGSWKWAGRVRRNDAELGHQHGRCCDLGGVQGLLLLRERERCQRWAILRTNEGYLGLLK